MKAEETETGRTKEKKKKLTGMLLISWIIALVLAVMITLVTIKSKLETSSDTTITSFTAIMQGYTHSFTLFEELLQEKLESTPDADTIETYLKKEDARLAALEGDDFDGVYLYYDGRYLYSWDTPYSVYEENGYDATTRPWYTGAVEAAGEICFSVPYRSYANDYMLATISRLQPDGKTVIAYDIKLGAIQSFASYMHIYQGALTLICDEAGNIIGTTEPLYAGGNFRLSKEEWDQEIDQDERNLKAASAEEKEKAEKQLQSETALRDFCSSNRDYLIRTQSNPGSLQFSLSGKMLSYAYDNGQYVCMVLIPCQKLLPTILLIGLILCVIFTLGILLVDNMRMRTRASSDLKYKNIQLAEAVVKADAANKAKSQFLAQMSHEIRTPMNAIIGLTSIAKTEVRSPEKISDYLNKIEGSSRLLLSIINDVLDMSAIDGGKMKIDKAGFNFRTMLTNLTTVFYEQAKIKNINFEVRMNGVTEENIIGDELRVNQILMNLLSNAVKFTPAGGEIDLMVLQASRSQGKEQLRFSVSDTGCGMSEEMMGRLFQPFEQESASTARKHGGSGLGLSIAKKLVEMMDGSIQVKSTLGKGTVFTVDIPFEVQEDDKKPVTVTDFKDIHVLVVDDDLDSCEYSGILLERLGVRYEYVTSGEAALEKLEDAEDAEDPFTLCLVDWKMPEMDGLELTKKIHEIFGEDEIVVIVSAYDLNEVEASAQTDGANYFIPKPLFQSTLFNALMKISGGDYTKIDIAEEKQKYDFTGKRVMVAEDVVLNMEVAVKLLNMVGVDVTCAEDGQQAVELFKKSEQGYYDCILMDINMPVMDGYEAAQAIRRCSRPDAKEIPIYAMTANAFSEDVTAALNAGMNGHIAKPIETAVLFKTLEHAFFGTEREKI